MEADWEFEVGGDAPVIDTLWQGFVDLRQAPESAWNLLEVSQFPALADALERLNATSSPVWTSKCDFWPDLEPGDFDADEMDAPAADAAHAAACYIDLLPSNHQQWDFPSGAAAACKRLCEQLRPVALRCGRVDLVIRSACIAPSLMATGLTAYITACGANQDAAMNALAAALATFVDSVCTDSTVQWRSTGE